LQRIAAPGLRPRLEPEASNLEPQSSNPMEHHLTTTHDRWNKGLLPSLEIEPGDLVTFECFDSTGGQVQPDSTVDDFLKIDRSKIHTLTGPIFIKGAKAGDAIRVEILDVQHHGWGWSSITPGLGFLPTRFQDPFLFIWKLNASSTKSLSPAVVPLHPFCGVMGVAPAEPGEFRTRAPGTFGGNMDVKELVAGSTLFLPVVNDGGLFSLGDPHAAQGDGEVCINGIECPATVRVKISLWKDCGLTGPMITTALRRAPGGGEWLMIESDKDALAAARQATNRMIDFLVGNWELRPEHAYLLCSVAMDLRLSQVVNTQVTVSASISKSILPNPGRLVYQ
jgi:acetamidase/formamidase